MQPEHVSSWLRMPEERQPAPLDEMHLAGS
jgi:hypothetical protein